MKVPKSVLKLLENKYVLYFVLFLAITNLLGYMMVGNMNAVILFTLLGGLMTFFSKNMIIVLAVPIVLTSVLLLGSKVSEGYTDGTATDASGNTVVTTTDNCGNGKIVTTDPSGNEVTTYVDKDDTPILAADYKCDAPAAAAKKDKCGNTINSDGTLTAADGTVQPADYTCKEAMGSLYKKKNNRIDYDSTLEDAYGDLDSILGKDGINSLTTDTQKLMEQQMALADALKGMAPLIGDAKKMLSGMDISGLTEMAKKIGNNGPQ